ncbi:MAG TPA: DinB family protein [Terriglobales bacterium]|nr:DinB family protein [Terriglobales bacterium]
MDSYLERLRQTITSATGDMSVEELTRQPEGKWSVAQVLEHLYLTYTGTQKAFERCLKAGKPLAGIPTLKQRVATTAVTGLGYFPKGRKSPDQVLPRGVLAEKVVAEIGPQIVTMDKAIADCEARYGSRVRVLDHPVLGPLTARQWRKFHLVHGRHHVKQILERSRSAARVHN